MRWRYHNTQIAIFSWGSGEDVDIAPYELLNSAGDRATHEYLHSAGDQVKMGIQQHTNSYILPEIRWNGEG